MLGLKTNRNSTNWYAKVGIEETHVIVAGCQIHYAVKCDNRPSAEKSKMTTDEGKGYMVPSKIFFAE